MFTDQEIPSVSPEPELSPGERTRRAVWRHLADHVRRLLGPVASEPNTPEAWAEREAAVIAIGASLNPATYAEAMYAAKAAATDAHQGAVCDDLVQCRGNLYWTKCGRAQYASMGRESRGALNALLKLQRERQRMSADAASEADAAGRITRTALAEALESLPPPPEPPPPVPLTLHAERGRSSRPGAAPAAGPPPPRPPKITRPPAPLPPSMAHLADRPDLPESVLNGPHAPPGYAPWEPGCTVPMWYTEIDDNMTEEQHDLRSIWLDANEFAIVKPLWAAAIRRHGGVPPGCDFPLPSPDIMHVLLHDNSSNFRWADTWQPHPEQRASHPEPCRGAG